MVYMKEGLSEINGKLLVLLGLEGLYETTHSKVVNKNPIMASGLTRNDAADQQSYSSSSSQMSKFHISRSCKRTVAWWRSRLSWLLTSTPPFSPPY
jgi:hypothetical protein